MEPTSKDIQKKWAKIVAKAWSDPQFKEQLIQDPTSVLKAEGFEVPSDEYFTVVENTSDKHYLIIPEQPEGALSEEMLQEISAGFSFNSNCFVSKGCGE